MTITELETASATADREFSRLNALAMSAEDEFERRKREATPSEFAKLSATAEQAKLKAEDARTISTEKSALLTAAREAEGRAQRQQTANAAYAAKAQEFNSCRETLLTQRKQFDELRDALAFGGQLHDRLLRELNVLKEKAAQAA